ncbi:MAG: alpha-glucosidase [Sporolactobacillus sp.]
MKQPWWHEAIVYQIYPKSFKDTNGDGIGDLKGIIEQLDYIKALGVTALWLNPIFKSPQVDNGYDVSDYYALDPQFGTMEDLEYLIAQAKQRDLKIILDLVVNHTSDRHPWFREARSSKDSPYRDYYIWREGTNHHEPTNWASFFGGSAWTYDPLTKQYYFHLFDQQMPDLNWENPQVRAEINHIAEFWASKGIDGFRLDAIIHLAKDLNFKSLPLLPGRKYRLAESCYANLPRVHELIHQLNGALKKKFPDLLLIGETASADAEMAERYTDPSREECDCAISFRHLDTEVIDPDPRLPEAWQEERLNFAVFKKTMREWQSLNKGWMALYWNNHDMPRLLSRFGDQGKYRMKSAKMLATLMYLQRGMPFILQGEEIGMANLKLPKIKDYADSDLNEFVRSAHAAGYSEKQILRMIQKRSKITSRGSMQWNDSAFAGFSSTLPWLGVNEDYKTVNTGVEDNDPDSLLHYYRKLLHLRGDNSLFCEGSCKQLRPESQSLYVYLRRYPYRSALVICNFTGENEVFHYPRLERWNCVLANCHVHPAVHGTITLSAYECRVYLLEIEEGGH